MFWGACNYMLDVQQYWRMERVQGVEIGMLKTWRSAKHTAICKKLIIYALILFSQNLNLIYIYSSNFLHKNIYNKDNYDINDGKKLQVYN